MPPSCRCGGGSCCSRLVRSGRCPGPHLVVHGCRQAGQEHSQAGVCPDGGSRALERPATSPGPSPAAPPHTHSTCCLPVSLLWVADWADGTASFGATRLPASWVLLCCSQLLDAASAGGARWMACAYMAWRSSQTRQLRAWPWCQHAMERRNEHCCKTRTCGGAAQHAAWPPRCTGQQLVAAAWALPACMQPPNPQECSNLAAGAQERQLSSREEGRLTEPAAAAAAPRPAAPRGCLVAPAAAAARVEQGSGAAGCRIVHAGSAACSVCCSRFACSRRGGSPVGLGNGVVHSQAGSVAGCTPGGTKHAPLAHFKPSTPPRALHGRQAQVGGHRSPGGPTHASLQPSAPLKLDFGA